MINNSKMEEDLRDTYNDILQLMRYADKSIEEDIRSLLNKEYGDYREQIQRRLERLEKREYPILVLGETSSEKSSFINLLVGETILPEAHLAETKVIFRLHNSSDIRYEAEYTTEKKYSEKFQTKQALSERLSKVIARSTNNQTNNDRPKPKQELSEGFRNDPAQRNNNQENNDRPKPKQKLFEDFRDVLPRRTNNQENNDSPKQALSEGFRNDPAQNNNNQENIERPKPKRKLFEDFRNVFAQRTNKEDNDDRSKQELSEGFHDVPTRRTNKQDNDDRPKQELSEGFRDVPARRNNNQENNDTIKRVDVYCPIPYLPDYTTIVEGPGVGEDDSLTEEVLRYLPKAVAFIFVFDSSNAGGIQTGKLGMILEAYENKKLASELEPFDFENSIVICNKWDVVEKRGEEDKVWDQTVKRLQDMMPLLEKDHIFRMNAKEALKHRRLVSGNTKQFDEVLGGLERILPGMMQAKLYHHHRWQGDVLNTMWEYTRRRIRHAFTSATDKKKHRIEIESQLEDLEKKSKETKRMLEATCQAKYETAVEALHSYLNKPEVKKSFIDWRKEKTPPHLKKCADQGVINLEIRKRVCSRLHKIILEWEEQEHILRSVSTDLGDRLKDAFSTIGIQCNEIDFTTAKIPENNFSDELAARSKRRVRSDSDLELDTTGKVVLAATAPVWIPAGLAAAIIGIPIAAAVAVVRSINKRLNYARTDFQRELHNYSEEVVKNAFGEKGLRTIITKSYFSAINEKIDNFFESEIGKEIASKRMMLEMVMREAFTSSCNIEALNLFLFELESIKKKFRKSHEKTNR